MPLRCLGPDDQNIQSFDLTNDEWAALRLSNRRSQALHMPCCDAPVVLKSSRLGTRFFAHKSRGTCTTALETAQHLILKTLAVDAARRAGWTCSTEERGSSPAGDVWTADVLATKGKHKVAIEIQWSGQTIQVTNLRQERYRQSDVRCLWLFRQREFPISEDLPAVCIVGNTTTGFQARITSDQMMPMPEFLDAVFAGRFRYGVAVGRGATVTVHSGVMDCWRCRASTRIITFIDIAIGPHRCQLTVADLGRFPDLLSTVVNRLPPSPFVGAIKARYSRMQGHISNGCYKCDALIGEHFEHDAWYSENSVLADFPIIISESWLKAIEPTERNFGWAVYPAEE